MSTAKIGHEVGVARSPDFIVIGAAKCGTTSLHRYLQQHPAVFVPQWGEPSFFAHEGQHLDYRGPGDDEWRFVTELRDYQALFAPASPEEICGDISPRYLYFENAPARIAHHAPGARLIAILREPVDRAYSHFLMNRARGCEPEQDFAEALTREAERARQGWGWDWQYVQAGLYHRQLQRYYERFPREQIRVFLHEEWRQDPPAFFTALFSFIGVAADFEPDTSKRERVAALPRSQALRAAIHSRNPLTSLLRRAVPDVLHSAVKTRADRWNATPPPPLDGALHRAIAGRFFNQDRGALEELLDRDLSLWTR